MEEFLQLFIKQSKYTSYRVDVVEKKEKYVGSEETYDATIATLWGISKLGGEDAIFRINSGKLPNWDDEQTEILRTIAKYLNDFSSYLLEESIEPLVQYWNAIRRKSIAVQKRKGVKNPWVPGGNFTLMSFEIFISHTMIAKFLHLKDISVLDFLDNGKDAFEKDIYRSILEPLDVYVRLDEIIESESDKKIATEKIIKEIIEVSKKHMFVRDSLLDPHFASTSRFITETETRELNSLFTLYEKLENKTQRDKKLDKIEKKLKLIEFWDSPQGKRLDHLNSLRVYGGDMTFEQREEAKRDQLQRYMDLIENILESWKIQDKYIIWGLQYYQDLYEESVYNRYVSDIEHKDYIDSSRKQIKEYGDILRGIWDSDHLNFIGILLGLVIGLAVEFASQFESYKWLWGIGMLLFSGIVLIGLFKWKVTRRWLSKLSKWVLE